MSLATPSRGLRQARHAASYAQLCSSLRLLQLSNPRYFSAQIARHEEKSQKTPKKSAQDSAREAILKLKEQQTTGRDEGGPKMGGLAKNSIFAAPATTQVPDTTIRDYYKNDFADRNMVHMDRALNPRPRARSRWQAKMVMRHVRRSGRLTREMVIARTERKHQVQSHFVKTSIKKMMPLARQIAGKSIEEAILQMRFSKKQVAQDVQAHLIQARNEAIVAKGMGRNSRSDPTATLPVGPLVLNPSNTPPQAHQTPAKALYKTEKVGDTDIYVAQAWVNRGKYEKKPEYRARGRINVLRSPHTSITLLLKEEKTRKREQVEKEIKVIRKRIGKNLWTQMPDRPITTQRQHVLW